MGICMDTGRKVQVNGGDVHVSSNGFGSWPRQMNGDSTQSRYPLRSQQQSRTMSEPIMVVSAGPRTDGSASSSDTSSSGPGPPKRIALTLQRKVEPVNVDNIPNAPIIFVLGGPGSGKITHCDRLAHIDDRLVHVNMQNTFLEVAAEIGSRDPNIVPAYKALEELVNRLSTMKSSQAFVITGYPRNMRDVVEFLARVNRVDGVILLDWSDHSLERQIQLGTKTGAIDPELARYELNNYRANIIPVAQFFSQQGHLNIVAGQRPPGEVFDDLGEEINGIVFHAMGDRPVKANGTTVKIEEAENEEKVDQEIGNNPTLPAETEVVVHTSPEMSKRKESIDSVDLMIAEEIQNITDDIKPAEELKIEEEPEEKQIVESAPEKSE